MHMGWGKTIASLLKCVNIYNILLLFGSTLNADIIHNKGNWKKFEDAEKWHTSCNNLYVTRMSFNTCPSIWEYFSCVWRRRRITNRSRFLFSNDWMVGKSYRIHFRNARAISFAISTEFSRFLKDLIVFVPLWWISNAFTWRKTGWNLIFLMILMRALYHCGNFR